MNLNFDQELKQYRMVVALKKVNRPLVNRGVLFNQKVLTACGEIHAGLMRCPKESQNKFMTDNPDFLRVSHGCIIWIGERSEQKVVSTYLTYIEC